MVNALNSLTSLISLISLVYSLRRLTFTNVILNAVKNLSVSTDFQPCTDLEILRYAQDDRARMRKRVMRLWVLWVKWGVICVLVRVDDVVRSARLCR